MFKPRVFCFLKLLSCPERLGFVATLMLAFALASLTFAQAPTGNIRGEITDPSGAVIPGATVKVTEVATARTLELKTNTAGMYAANLLIPGEYQVRIEVSGFKAFERHVTVRAGDTIVVNAQLEVGTPTTAIEVTAASEVLVDTVRSTVDGVVTAQQIDQMPLNARNFLELAALEPGVYIRDGGDIDPTKSKTYRTVGILGRSGTATRVQIDGIDVTDETVGTTMANISDDAVQEFQLSQSSLDLTTSLTSSGAVSIISRSGSNTVHGSGFWFYRNQDMGARLQFLPEAADFHRTQVGYRAGGPFVKDKLFWFSNWERTYQTEREIYRSDANFPNVPFGSSNNCLQGCSAGVPLDIRLLTERLDWVIRDNVRAFYRFSHDMNSSTGTGTIPNNPYINADWTNVNALGLDISTARFSHSLRLGHSTFNNRIFSAEFSGFEFPKTPQGTPYYLGVGAYSLGPNGLAPQATAQTNIQSKYDGTFVYSKHTFRYGLEINRILLGGFANFAGPLSLYGVFNSDTQQAVIERGDNPQDPLQYPLDDFSTGPNNGFFSIDGCFKWPHGCHRNTRIAWYAGDTWKARRNLTFTLGTRWEYDTGYFNDESKFTRPDYLNYWLPGLADHPKMPKNKFGPQFGFAWDPKGDGKTSIRGGFYIAYEMNIYNNLIFDQYALIPPGIGPDFYTSSWMALPNGDPITPALAGVSVVTLPASCQSPSALAGLDEGDWSCLQGNPIGNITGVIGQVDQTLKNAYATYQFDPKAGAPLFETALGNTYGYLVGGSKFKIPYSEQYNIGFQREIRPGHVLSVDFLANHGFHLPFLGVDLECRRCAETLNVTKAQAAVNNVLGGLTVDEWIAANPGATIADFGLATDSIFQGRTPDANSSFPETQSINFRRARVMSNGGVSQYFGLQVRMKGRLRERFDVGGRPLLRNMTYVASYAIGSAKATMGSERSEFLNLAYDKHNPHNKAYFGNSTAIDHRHMISGGVMMDTIAGFRLGQFWTFRTPPPMDLWIPALGNVSGSSRLFTTDFLGVGSNGSGAPLDAVIPGTTLGSFGRAINSWSDLNNFLTSYNNTYAGQLTPAGRALVNAGIFTEAQLKALSAVMPSIPLVPTGNPWPFQNVFNVDLSITRPIHLKLRHVEELAIEPWLQIFNVFNRTGLNSYGGLDTSFGSWNYDYATPADRSDLTLQRGRNQDTRLLQIGVRVTF
jgi:hypothetical protein